MKFKKGFTIVEVLVVIGIIAVLTVIIFPAINNIRAKNRDAERVADLAAIQLGLALYYSQHTTSNGNPHSTGYPANLDTLVTEGYITNDTRVGVLSATEYTYVPLSSVLNSSKCTYYHLGVALELPNAQIDMTDQFDSTVSSSDDPIVSGGYYWCGGFTGSGLTPPSPTLNNYNVHP